MTYGAEAVIPLKSGFLTLRTDQFSVEENNPMCCEPIVLYPEDQLEKLLSQ